MPKKLELLFVGQLQWHLSFNRCYPL